MSPDYPKAVELIVADYLDKLRKQVNPLPSNDREELLREIESHIFESYRDEPGVDEVDRILRVLRKLGEPVDVMAARVPDTMVAMGKRKNAPYYIILGVVIALFGLPLGLGGLSVVLGLVVTILALVLAYFVMAGSFVLAGLAGAIASVIHLLDPTFFDRAFRAMGAPGARFFDVPGIVLHPQLEGIVGLFISLLMIGLGILMIWAGRKIPRGLLLLVSRSWEAVRKWARTAKKNASSNSREKTSS